MRLWSTSVRTRTPTAKGGVGLRGRGGLAGALGVLAEVAGLAVAVDPVGTVNCVLPVCGGEVLELAPPHPARSAAIATPNAARLRIRDGDNAELAVG